ncbi:Arylsulfatase [Pontiella desulfatans]|uniref:Arylsulfatase n=1 Tax=Pontiella desulfatans TaxID=2750659 RepID=A0A6C2U218_PONDE|nr:sulfatase [Pontiella desulfatans]SPS73912.1 sulfatase S1_16 [Kiritimatiellales bacterium]VGO14030.1 Arylsulfatase [Pontiella desulfatans]
MNSIYLGVALATVVCMSGCKEQQTNIIFILADDLGYMDVGGYAEHVTGTPVADQFYETPNLDRLMKEGLSFSRAYATQLCSPTRASLLTGRYAPKLGFTTASWPGMPTYHMEGQTPPAGLHPQDVIYHFDKIKEQQAWKNGGSITALRSEEITIAEQLPGYHSAFLGKWHVGGHGAEGYQPADQGFDPIAWFDAGGSPYFDWHARWNNTKTYSPKMAQQELQVGDAGDDTEQDYLTDDLTQKALTYLDERTGKDKPFLLYFNHFAVHGPWQSRSDYQEYFDGKASKGWNGHDNAAYAGMLKSLDDSVGALMEKLRETGLDKNTLVVFMSDNGGLLEVPKGKITSNAPLKGGKAMLNEGGTRVPLIVWAPGRVPADAWSDVAVHCTDIFPTLSEVADYGVDHEIDGQSLLPLLNDLDNSEGHYDRDTFYWHYPFNVSLNDVDHGLPLTPRSSMVEGDWKLIFDWHGKLELYNLADDLSEQNNLADAMPDRANEMFEDLKEWLEENVEPHYFPTPNPDYDAAQDHRPYPFRNLWTD